MSQVNATKKVEFGAVAHIIQKWAEANNKDAKEFFSGNLIDLTNDPDVSRGQLDLLIYLQETFDSYAFIEIEVL